MSIKKCCSLCYTACSEYKLLENDIGGSNESYEITVKYFDPMLLTEEENSKYAQEVKALCQDCWSHIKDFHEFQQTVLKTRALFEKSKLQQEPVEVKQENREDDKTSTTDKQEYHFEGVGIKKNTEDYDDDLKADTMSINCDDDGDDDDDDDDDDDEKPLIKFKTTEVKNKENEILQANYNKKDENTKSRSGRKLKNYTKDDFNPEISDELDLEKPASKRKKVKLTNHTKNIKLSHNMEKGKESDIFISEWKPELECDICSETASNFDKLRRHFREKHKTRCYIKCCERKFYRRYVLVDHIRLHLNPETHKCDICGKPSSSKYNLKLHKKVMHESTEQFECDVCHKTFNQKPTLERHMLTHVTGDKDFVCQECGKAYVLEVQLKSHIKTVHNIDRVCDQCGKTIHGIAALKKHLMEHAGVEKPKFPCDECGAELISRNGLRRHKAAFHHDGSTIYVCGICGKVASSENALLTHKKHVHEGERKHKCTFCDKAFKRPKVLREHIATHTGQDLYQCPHCSQTFKVSANMHHHRKKMHPLEWEEGRKNRLQLPKVNINQVKNQVVI